MEFCPSGEELLPEWGVVTLVDHLPGEVLIEHDKSAFCDVLTI